MFDPEAPDILAPGHRLARGVCRFLIDEGLAPITEYVPTAGLRTDVTALASDGEIWVIECKSSVVDFQSDQKWQGYLDWCDRFFFAVPGDFPDEMLPSEHGLIRADGYGAEVTRWGGVEPMAPARRKAQTLRLSRVAALRLRAQIDPSLRPMMGAGLNAIPDSI